jgi:hypothetical protein
MSALAEALAGCALAPHQFLPQRHIRSPSAQEAQLNHRQPQATTAQLHLHSASTQRAAAEVEILALQAAMVVLVGEVGQTPEAH